MNAVKHLEDLAAPSPSPLLAWSQPLRDELEHRLRQLRRGDALPAIAAHLFAAGGKRLRGLVALSLARDAGLDDAVALTLAEVVELAHGATLLHDDVIDEAERRRGQAAARVRWCNTLSILAGDHVLLRALAAVHHLGAPALMGLFLDTLDEVITAEALQHVQAEQGSLDVAGYLEVARGKTGALFGLACAAPALLAGRVADASALGQAGRHAGLAFQILDDVRDVIGADPTKQALQDVLDGVPSLPLRLAARRHPALGHALREVRQGLLAPDVAAAVVGQQVDGEALGEAIALGRQHLERARAALAPAGSGTAAQALLRLVDWIDEALRGTGQVPLPARPACPLAVPRRRTCA